MDRLGYPLLFGDKSGDVAGARFEDQAAGTVFNPCFWIDSQNLTHLSHELFPEVSNPLCRGGVVGAELHLESRPRDVPCVGFLEIAQAMR